MGKLLGQCVLPRGFFLQKFERYCLGLFDNSLFSSISTQLVLKWQVVIIYETTPTFLKSAIFLSSILVYIFSFQDSLELSVQELVGRDNTVQINVIRQQGFFGHVIAKWVATGDHDGSNDITPLEGRVIALYHSLGKISR